MALCEQSTEQMVTWTKKAFCDAYRAHVASGLLTASAAAKLPGIIAADRARGGYDQPAQIEVETHLPPVKIKVAENADPVRAIADRPEFYRVGKSVSVPLFDGEQVDEPEKTPMTLDEPREKLNEQREKIEAAKQALLKKYKT